MVLSKDMKIAICFGLIMGAIISVFNMCFAAETEDVEFSTLSNVAVNAANTLVSYNGSTLYYVELQGGYRYYISNVSSSERRIALLPSLEIGTTASVTLLGAHTNMSVVGSSQFLYVGSSSTGDVANTLKVTREKIEGLSGFVDNVAYSLSYVNLNSIVANVVPILSIGVLLGLGFYLLKRILNKIKRAKGGV